MHLLGQVPGQGEPEAVAAAPPGGRIDGAVDLEEALGGAGLHAAPRVLDLERGDWWIESAEPVKLETGGPDPAEAPK